MPLAFGFKLVVLSHRTANPDHPLIVKKALVLVRVLGLFRSNQTTYQGEIPATPFGMTFRIGNFGSGPAVSRPRNFFTWY